MRFLHVSGLFFGIVFFFASGFTTTAFAEIAVIVHPNLAAEKISKRELTRLYLGESRRLEDGTELKPVDLAEDSEIRAAFYQFLAGLDQFALRRYWSKRMFTGKGMPPPVFHDSEAVKKWVAGNPSAIGYINTQYLDTSVKVLPVLQ